MNKQILTMQAVAGSFFRDESGRRFMAINRDGKGRDEIKGVEE